MSEQQGIESLLETQTNSLIDYFKPFNYELLDKTTEIEYLIKPYLPKGVVGILHGDPGSSKSLLSLYFAISILSGKDFFGCPVKKGRVCIISFEESTERIANRLKHILVNTDTNRFVLENLVIADFSSKFINFIDNEKDFEDLKTILNSSQFDLIIIDTFRRFAVDTDENTSNDTSKVLGKISEMTNARATALVLHHNNKQKTMRGSTALEGNSRFVLGLIKDSISNLVTLKVEKNNEGPIGKNTEFQYAVEFNEQAMWNIVPTNKNILVNKDFKVVLDDHLKKNNNIINQKQLVFEWMGTNSRSDEAINIINKVRNIVGEKNLMRTSRGYKVISPSDIAGGIEI